MEEGVLRLEQILQNSTKPLSFVIVFPNWVEPPTPSISMLQSPRFQQYLK